MTSHTINVLLTSFPGLGLPPTLSIPTTTTTALSDFTRQLNDRLPIISSRLVLTTNSNRALQPSSPAPISSLLSHHNDSILPLRLAVPLCGGKGGFGSQLRAAGGRMSSRRKKNAGENNSSNRNLDGRRLRTVNEAKALAEYLALKPEMEKKEKDARRRRWEQVIELAERKEDEIRGGNKGKVDGKWVEDKEEAGERAREAVQAAMRVGAYHDNLGVGSHETPHGCVDSESENSESQIAKNKVSASKDSPGLVKLAPSRTYFGFDDDDDEQPTSDESSVSEEQAGCIMETPMHSNQNRPMEGKGKARL